MLLRPASNRMLVRTPATTTTWTLHSIFLSCSITCTIIRSQCKVISECFSVECKYEVNKNDVQHSHIMSSKAFKQKFSLSHLFHYYHHSTLQPFGITLAAIPPLHAPSPTPFLLPAMVCYSNKQVILNDIVCTLELSIPAEVIQNADRVQHSCSTDIDNLDDNGNPLLLS